MIGIEHVFGAVGLSIGMVFATACITFERVFYEEFKERKRIADARRGETA